MFQRSFSIYTVKLPLRRPFQWRVFAALLALYFLGNLAALPLLRATHAPIEPVWFWGLATLAAALLIALSMALANRSGLGAPFLEGLIPKGDLRAWLKSGAALTVLMSMVGLPFSLLLNLNADPASYPAGWQLVLASIKAGVVEEIAYRFFLISVFVWVGSFLKRDAEGRPGSSVYWAANLIAALLFGWAHVEARLGDPQAPVWALAGIMVASTYLGGCFGWLLWKLGLEWAILAHFMYDAFISAMLIPVYLLKSPLVWALLVIGLIIATILAWRTLAQTQPQVRSQEA